MEWEADELLVLARLDMQKGTVDAALQKLKQARRLPDASPAVEIELARLYAQLGLRQKAIPLFRAYLESTPSDLDARFQLGMAHFEEGDVGTAMTIWEAVLASDPRYPPALFYRALALAQAGQVETAKPALRLALETLPPDNLYFARSRELLTALENGIAVPPAGASADFLAADPGKKQH